MNRPQHESLSLLHHLMHNPLEPGYQAAAARPVAQRSALTTPTLFVVMLLAGLIVGAGVTHLRDLADGTARATITAQVENAAQEREHLESEIRELTTTVEHLATRLDSTASAIAQPTSTTTGIVVDIADPQTDALLDEPLAPGALLMDTDLQVIANSLFACGATHIAINGETLGPTSAIREAGESILVNYRPLVSPYRFEVIGEYRVATCFETSLAGHHLRRLRSQYGVTYSVDRGARIAVTPVSGAGLRHARPLAVEESS